MYICLSIKENIFFPNRDENQWSINHTYIYKYGKTIKSTMKWTHTFQTLTFKRIALYVYVYSCAYECKCFFSVISFHSRFDCFFIFIYVCMTDWSFIFNFIRKKIFFLYIHLCTHTYSCVCVCVYVCISIVSVDMNYLAYNLFYFIYICMYDYVVLNCVELSLSTLVFIHTLMYTYV